MPVRPDVVSALAVRQRSMLLQLKFHFLQSRVTWINLRENRPHFLGDVPSVLLDELAWNVTPMNFQKPLPHCI